MATRKTGSASRDRKTRGAKFSSIGTSTNPIEAIRQFGYQLCVEAALS